MIRKTPLKSRSSFRIKMKSKSESEHKLNDEKPKRKSRSTESYVKDMDKVFQYWIRLRDSMPGGYCRCISCSRIVPFDKIQAGHFMSRKHMITRWNPLNCNGECAGCNMDTSGNHLFGYEANLKNKIGDSKVQWLKAESKRSKKWSHFEIVIMIKNYSMEILRLSSSKKIPISLEVQRIIKKYQKISI